MKVIDLGLEIERLKVEAGAKAGAEAETATPATPATPAPPAPPATPVETIRPEIQTLIARGNIRMDEIPTNGNPTEASAMVPKLTNQALGLRINRVLAKYPVAAQPGDDPILSPHALYVMADEAARRIQHEPVQLWPNLKNKDLGQRILDSVKTQGGRPGIARTYAQALRQLAHEAATRLIGCR